MSRAVQCVYTVYPCKSKAGARAAGERLFSEQRRQCIVSIDLGRYGRDMDLRRSTHKLASLYTSMRTDV